MDGIAKSNAEGEKSAPWREYPSPPKKMSGMRSRYYIVVEEWLYPTEGGRDYIEDYDTFVEARAKALELVKSELHNFASATGCEPSAPDEVQEDGRTAGIIITDKSGFEDWWYAVKIIPVAHGFDKRPDGRY